VRPLRRLGYSSAPVASRTPHSPCLGLLGVTGEACELEKCSQDLVLCLHNVANALATQATEKLVAAVIRGQAGQSL
jgi:hypothetical protein